MAIQNLPIVDEVTSNSTFAGNINGLDVQFFANVLLAYMQGNLVFPSGGYVTQYAAPSATGFSVAIAEASADTHLILTPTGGFAAGTIVLPAVGTAVDGQRVQVNCTQAVTTLTINGNGGTVTGAPTTLAANAFFTLAFDDPTNVWYRVG